MGNTNIEGFVGYSPYSCKKQNINIAETAAYADIGPLVLGSGLVRFHKDKEELKLSYFDNKFWLLFWQLGLNEFIDKFNIVGVDLGGFLQRDNNGKIYFKLTDAKYASNVILAVRDPERKFESQIAKHPGITYYARFTYDEQEKVSIMILSLDFRTKYESFFYSESPFDEDPDPGDWVQWAETATNDELLRICGFPV